MQVKCEVLISSVKYKKGKGLSELNPPCGFLCRDRIVAPSRAYFGVKYKRGLSKCSKIQEGLIRV